MLPDADWRFQLHEEEAQWQAGCPRQQVPQPGGGRIPERHTCGDSPRFLAELQHLSSEQGGNTALDCKPHKFCGISVMKILAGSSSFTHITRSYFPPEL